MKIRFLQIVIGIIISVTVSNSQDITNTLAPDGVFTVKDGVTEFLRLSQTTGNLSLFRNLEIGNAENSTADIGVITKNGQPFIHNYKAPDTDGFNTFIGLNSGNFNLGTGSNTASYNTAVGENTLSLLTAGWSNSAFGAEALYSNGWGMYNSAFGSHVLYHNTSGWGNSAFGSSALSTNVTGNRNSAFGFQSLYYNHYGTENSAFGSSSLMNNTIGNNNSAFGVASLNTNTTGNFNSAFGRSALFTNSTGESNSAFGRRSLALNEDGNFNSALGNEALYSNVNGANNSAVGYKALFTSQSGNQNTAFGSNALENLQIGNGNTVIGTEGMNIFTQGNNNIAVGYQAGHNQNSGNNNIIIGYMAQLPSFNIGNQIRLGNNLINYAGIQVPWTITSDIRWKENIQPSDLGLSFITKLNPVSYTRKNDEQQRKEYGLIAQDLEELFRAEGIEKTGMLTITDEGFYELRYNDLIAPMIKAIQELKMENELLTIKNQKLASAADGLEIRIEKEISRLNEENSKLKTDLENLIAIKNELTEIESLKEELNQQIKELKSVQKEYENNFSSVEK